MFFVVKMSISHVMLYKHIRKKKKSLSQQYRDSLPVLLPQLCLEKKRVSKHLVIQAFLF